jgi:hypothetical protein
LASAYLFHGDGKQAGEQNGMGKAVKVQPVYEGDRGYIQGEQGRGQVAGELHVLQHEAPQARSLKTFQSHALTAANTINRNSGSKNKNRCALLSFSKYSLLPKQAPAHKKMESDRLRATKNRSR